MSFGDAQRPCRSDVAGLVFVGIGQLAHNGGGVDALPPVIVGDGRLDGLLGQDGAEIGRASCRERV